MKRLDELKISPTPWNIKFHEIPAEYGGGRIVGGIVSRNGGTRIDLNMGIADARLIKTAPKMYDALQKIVQCWGGSSCECGMAGGPPMHCQIVGCKPQNCPIILNAKSVLAEAAGESEAK